MPPKEQPHPKIDSEASSLAQTLAVAIEGRESLSRLFRYRVELQDPQGGGPAWDDLGKEWLNKQVTIDLEPLDPATEGVNTIRGVVVAAEMLGAVGDPDSPAVYRIEIAPKLFLLSLTRRTRVFTDKTILDVVQEVLRQGNVTFEMRAVASKYAHPSNLIHVTQYDETDLDFVLRLLEDEGVCFWFEHTATTCTMVMANETGHYPGADDAISIADTQTLQHDPAGIGLRVAIVPTETRSAGYDYNNPTAPRLGSKTIASTKAPVRQGSYTVLNRTWASGGQIVDTAAAIEADRHVNRACTFQGWSKDIRFRAGRRVKMSQCDCLLVEVGHEWRHPIAIAGGTNYHNTFAWVTWSALPWRPPQEARRPRLDSPVPGIITATAGNQGGQDEAALDGSYRVKLLNPDETPDRVARLAQPYGGTERGLHCPLPVDTEVLVTHVNGDPDMPVITGVAPNFNHPGPVAEANNTQCVLKTGSGHILVFEDKQDEEKVSLTTKSGHALVLDDKPDAGQVGITTKGTHKLLFDDTKDAEQVVLTGKAGNKLTFDEKADNEKITLQGKAGNKLIFDEKSGSEKITLEGMAGNKLVFDEKSGSEKITLTAKKDHESTVAGTSKTTVTGKTEVACDDEIVISANKKITLKVGGASIEIDSSGNITIKGTNAKVEADSAFEAKGVNVKVEGSAQTEVKGGMVKVEASGILEAKGSLIKLN